MLRSILARSNAGAAAIAAEVSNNCGGSPAIAALFNACSSVGGGGGGCASTTATRCISTNERQQNTSAAASKTAETSISATDKCLHFNNIDGYYKSSPLEAAQAQNMPLDKYVWSHFKKWESKIAAVCVVSGRQYTFAELRDSSAALAVRLQINFKLGKNDVVAICLPNLPEYPIATLAAIEAGTTVTSVNPIYTADEIARQLTASDAKFIIGTAAGYGVLQQACQLAKKSVPIVVVRMRADEPLPAGAIDFFELIKPQGVDYKQLKQYDIGGEDIVFLPFSSGTTGLPKGVMLTHNNITVNCEQVQNPIPFDTLAYQDVVPAILPFFHIYGLTVVMLSKLYLGCKLVTMPQFKPDDLMKSLNEYKGSILNLVPPIALFMINHPGMTVKTAPELRMAMSGAAPIGSHDVERFLKKFPKTEFLQGFGMTESSPVALLTPMGNTRYASVGVLPGSTEAKIVSFESDSTVGLGPNQVGELCIRGPQVMKGYLRNEQANKETFFEGRWLRTGDVAFYDDDGYFYITDRMKELIKVKGFQVPPAELEAKLRDHPKILEAAVIGVPHEVNGEAPKAIVVLRAGEEATEEEIYNYIAEQVAHYKKLEGGIVFVKEVLKSPTGKILRRELKKIYS